MEQLVQLLRARAELNNLRPALVELRRCREPHWDNLQCFGENLLRFRFADALDGDEMLLGRVRDSFDRMEPGFLQLATVKRRNPLRLQKYEWG